MRTLAPHGVSATVPTTGSRAVLSDRSGRSSLLWRTSAAAAAWASAEKRKTPAALKRPASDRPRRLSFKETRELERMEADILAVEENIARIEALFAEPDFHRKHGQRTEDLTTELAEAKQRMAALYERWQALEAIRAESPS